jgi:hypothetical protein
MMKPSLKRLRSKAKYKTNTKEYAVWNEYDLTTGDRVLVSGGMCLLKSYNKLSSMMLDDENKVELLYIIEAATSEEASAIRDLRLYGTPYVPQGKSVDCPTCGEFQVFPESSNECPCCGPQD